MINLNTLKECQFIQFNAKANLNEVVTQAPPFVEADLFCLPCSLNSFFARKQNTYIRSLSMDGILY